MTKGDDEFELEYHLGQVEHYPEHCKMCGYCTGEWGHFTFACRDEKRKKNENFS